MALNQIDQLVYISQSRLRPDEAEAALIDIAQMAHRLNQQNQITGALALVDGYFVQLLEGAPAALDLLMIHLQFDQRHSHIEVVARAAVPKRAIPNWGMIAPALGHALPPHLAQALKERPTSLQVWREALIGAVLP